MGTIKAPILYPSREEFNNPIEYLNSKEIVKLGEQCGMVKIIPPKNWNPPFSINKETFKFITRFQILNELNLINRSRDFWLNGFINFIKSVGKFKKYENILINSKGYLNIKNNNNKLNNININNNNNNKFKKIHLYDIFISKSFDNYKKLLKDNIKLIELIEKYSNQIYKFDENNDDESIKDNNNNNDYYSSLLNKSGLMKKSTNKRSTSCEICGLSDKPTKILICDGEDCNKLFHMYCLEEPLKIVPKNEWFCKDCLSGTDCNYGFEEDFDSKFTLEEFKEHCDEFKSNYLKDNLNSILNPSVDVLEKEFWKLVNDNKNENGNKINQEINNHNHDNEEDEEEDDEVEVRYGADIHNETPGEISGFPMAVSPNIDHSDDKIKEYIKHPFNLTNLPFCKGSLLNYIRSEENKDEQISGMTIPWVYVGSLFSTFCWHKEDHYTLSANYCHIGDVKKWYGIPAEDCNLFEKICDKLCPDYFKKQPDLLHQLVSLISPSELNELSIKFFNKKIRIYDADQYPNEFIVTYPKVYHAGFNCGFNVNEAVNFTMPYWLDYGKQAIEDYKLVKRDNVFNNLKLFKRMLKDYKIGQKNLLNDNDNANGNEIENENHLFLFNDETIKLIKDTINDEIVKFNKLYDLKTIELLSNLKNIEYQDYKDLKTEELRSIYRSEKKRRRSTRSRSHSYSNNTNKKLKLEMSNSGSVGNAIIIDDEDEDDNNNEEDNDENNDDLEEKKIKYIEDELICEECKSCVNFVWIEFDALKELEYEGNLLFKKQISKYENQFKNINHQHQHDDDDNENNKMIIESTLPTPQNSPRLNLNRDISNTNNQFQTDEESEFQRIIEEAKKSASNFEDSRSITPEINSDIINKQSETSLMSPFEKSDSRSSSVSESDNELTKIRKSKRISKKLQNFNEITSNNNNKHNKNNNEDFSKFTPPSSENSSRNSSIITLLPSINSIKRSGASMRRIRNRNPNFGKVILCLEDFKRIFNSKLFNKLDNSINYSELEHLKQVCCVYNDGKPSELYNLLN
ncbi:catalytic activity protein [[Candida] boidinii]|nr:catalytic activity protein [[Candida] boidinii]